MIMTTKATATVMAKETGLNDEALDAFTAPLTPEERAHT